MFGFLSRIPGTVSIRKLLLAFFFFSFPYGLAEEFWARRWHASIIVANWIYIDGGEVAYVGNTSLGEKIYNRENSTYGLDLSKDWTNSSVTLIRTLRPSDSLALSSASLWHDEKRDTIYCFGGDISDLGGDAVPPDSIWGFKPNGGGGGDWHEVLGPTSATPFPQNIHRISTGTSAYDSRSAYHLGGFASSKTSQFYRPDRFPSSGLLTFDFDTLLMTNSSDGGYITAIWGGSHYNRGAMINIPTFDDNNLLIILPSGRDRLDFAFNNVTLFDKKNKKWYSQLTSGDIPKPRSYFCAVGVQEEGNLNFEIFIHGGIVDNVMGSETVNSDQLYILSLPSFRWFLANHTTTNSRAAHTCHATNSNQMIIIGGMDPTYSLDTLSNNHEKDPWTQGIGVFDMTALQFKDSYQANAERYKTPDIIRRFYSIDGNNYPSSWTSTAVKEFFEIKSNKTSNTTNPTPSNSTVQPNPSHSTVSASQSQLSRGAISGLVVGCISTLGLCAIGAMYIIRRKSKNTKSSYLQELPPEQRTQEVDGQSRDPPELPNTSKKVPVEMSANAPSAAELSGVRYV